MGGACGHTLRFGLFHMASSALIDLELIRASVQLESDPAAAARSASAILNQSPGHEAANLLLAAACRRIGDPATATSLLQSLVRADPTSAVLQLELGRATAAAGRNAEAIAALECAVALDARLADAWRELAALRFASGDTLGGDAAYAQYSRFSPQPPELKDAADALGDERLDAANTLLEKRLFRAPGDVVALRMQASIAIARGDPAGGERILNHCLALAPGYAEARFDLASELAAQQRHVAVLPLVERLLLTDPHDTRYLCLKALALRLDGRHGEAVELMQQVVVQSPDDAKARLAYGNVLRESGERAGAIEAYRQALALQPGMGEAWWSLANLKTLRFTADDRATMLQQLTRSAPTGNSRTSLEFALGKALEDSRQFAQSFEHYARGNALRRATIFHDAELMSADVRRSKALYSKGFFVARSDWGSERADPIFIVGLPRSGSTLLEQILASHSQIEGTRELPDLPDIVMALADHANPDAIYPDCIATRTRPDIEAYAARYLRQTQSHRRLSKPRFVDKMLGNFCHVGLIQLMFPRATIIDSRRHPLACGFSCYKQLFARGLTFTYDQEEFGRFYCDYADLMQHMDQVLPGRVHRVYYERLVADPEGEVRRLLDHCGLLFEEGCLKFYETRRIVNTISSEQVRQPINADGVQQWRNFEPWLGPMAASLGDLVGRYPSFTSNNMR